MVNFDYKFPCNSQSHMRPLFDFQQLSMVLWTYKLLTEPWEKCACMPLMQKASITALMVTEWREPSYNRDMVEQEEDWQSIKN